MSPASPTGSRRKGLWCAKSTATDRRVFRVRLTAEGGRQFRRMAAEHEQWVIDLFGPLGTKQKKQLRELLGELKSACQPTTQRLRARRMTDTQHRQSAADDERSRPRITAAAFSMAPAMAGSAW